MVGWSSGRRSRQETCRGQNDGQQYWHIGRGVACRTLTTHFLLANSSCAIARLQSETQMSSACNLKLDRTHMLFPRRSNNQAVSDSKISKLSRHLQTCSNPPSAGVGNAGACNNRHGCTWQYSPIDFSPQICLKTAAMPSYVRKQRQKLGCNVVMPTPRIMSRMFPPVIRRPPAC